MRNHLPNEGREIQELLTDLMRQYFCEANPQPLMDRFADDILWLGSGEAQTGEGRAAVTANFERARAQLVPTKMSQDVARSAPSAPAIGWPSSPACWRPTPRTACS